LQYYCNYLFKIRQLYFFFNNLLNKNFIYFKIMQINCFSVRLIILLILSILFRVALYIAFIILRFNIILLFSIKDK